MVDLWILAVPWEEYGRSIHLFLSGLGKGVDVDFRGHNIVGIGHSMGAVSLYAFPHTPSPSTNPFPSFPSSSSSPSAPQGPLPRLPPQTALPRAHPLRSDAHEPGAARQGDEQPRGRRGEAKGRVAVQGGGVCGVEGEGGVEGLGGEGVEAVCCESFLCVLLRGVE